MGIFSYIILGLIAGILGKFLMPGKDPGGFFITILLGIGGALLGAFLGSKLLGFGGLTGAFDFKSILAATGGVVVLLFIYRLVKKKG